MFTLLQRPRTFLSVCLFLAFLVTPSWASPGGTNTQRSYLHRIQRGQTVDIRVEFPNGSCLQSLPNLPRGLQMVSTGPDRWRITGRLDPRTPLGLYEIRMGSRFRLTFNCVQSLTAWSQHADLTDGQRTDHWNPARFETILRTGYSNPTPGAANPARPYDLVALQGVRHTLIRRQLLTQTLLRNQTHQHPAGSTAFSQRDDSGLVPLVGRQFKVMRHFRFSFPRLGSGRNATPAGGFTLTQIGVNTANQGEYLWLVNVQLSPGPVSAPLRRNQLWQLQRRIDQLTDRDHPVLLLGNLNVPGDSFEYRSLLSGSNTGSRPLLDGFVDGYRLVHALPTDPSYAGVTFDRLANPYARKRFVRPDGQRTYGFGPQQRLDYVLVRQGRLYQLGINALECMNRPSERLSPHYGLKARFHLIHPRVVSSSSMTLRSHHGSSSPSPLTRSRGNSLPGQRDGDRGLPSDLDLRRQRWAETVGKGLGLTGEDVLGQLLGGNGQSILDQLTAHQEEQQRQRRSHDPFSEHRQFERGLAHKFPGSGGPSFGTILTYVIMHILHDAHTLEEFVNHAEDFADAGRAVARSNQTGTINKQEFKALRQLESDPKADRGDPQAAARAARQNANDLQEISDELEDKAYRLTVEAEEAARNATTPEEKAEAKRLEEEARKAREEAAAANVAARKAREEAEKKEKAAGTSKNQVDPPDPFDGTVIETPEHRIDLDRIFLVREKSGFLRAANSEIGQRVNEANSRPGAGDEGRHGPYPGTQRPNPGSGLKMPAPESGGAAGEDPRAHGVASRSETDPGPETTNPDPSDDGGSGGGGQGGGTPPPPPPAPYSGGGAPGGGFGGGSSPPRGQPTR